MKKIFLSLSILLTAVVCTACINNLAIQELNNKAQEYMKLGDTDSAICRLKSSLDLDGNFFETNYNLSLAYIEKKDWENAQLYLEKTVKINPEFPDSYYSLGYVYENLADDIANGTKKLNANGEELSEESNEDYASEVVLSQDEKNEILEYYSKALAVYSKFIDITPDNRAKEDTKRAMASIERQIEKYSDEADTQQ